MSNPMTCHPVALESPIALASFVERQVYKAWLNGDVERRSENRCEMVVPVLIQPLDAQFNAVGTPFSTVTRDVSPKGIGFVHSEPLDHSLLALQMSIADEEMNLVAEVRWCKKLGRLYHIGASLVSLLRASQFPDGSHRSPMR